MTDNAFRTLADVIGDELFPEVDLLLREGRHIDDLDLESFTFLEDARPWLESFYYRYGCDLVRMVERYYYLRPRGDRLGRRGLSAAEMLVGQALCLLRLDPATLRTTGRAERVQVLGLLERLVGSERLGVALNPRRKRRSKAVEEEEIRTAVDGAIRTLARLGFVDDEGAMLRLRAPLLRFTEPVASQPRPDIALARLVGTGVVDAEDQQEEEEPE